jgi:hypothetical protein
VTQPELLVSVAHFSFDRSWIVTTCNVGAAPWLAAAVGRNLWQTWPLAEPLFRPGYEQAWREGEAHFAQFFTGYMFDVHAVRSDDGRLLRVSFLEADMLDVTSVSTVIESLSRMRHRLEAQGPAGRPPPRPALRQVAPPRAG